MTRDNPLARLHQTTVHQLRHAADEIESGDGLVTDFDYDEELVTDDVMVGRGLMDTVEERIVTVELTFLLPE